MFYGRSHTPSYLHYIDACTNDVHSNVNINKGKESQHSTIWVLIFHFTNVELWKRLTEQTTNDWFNLRLTPQKGAHD